MAGAVSGAYAAVINETGAAVYDAVLGSSAGAMNAAFCVTGEAQRGVTIYPRHLCDGRFLSTRRIFSLDPIMNVDFLVDTIFSHVEPLNYRALSSSTIPFSITATTRCGRPRLKRLNNLSRPKIEEALKATARIPFIAQGWRTDEHKLLDGCLTQPIPLLRPKPNTKTLVFLNHSLHTTICPNDAVSSAVEFFLRWKDPCLSQLFEIRRNALFSAVPILQSSSVSVVAPKVDLIDSSEQTPKKIWDAMRYAYRQFAEELGISNLSYPQLWQHPVS